MLYQKLLIGKDPYYLSVGRLHKFPEHRHPEAELIYCMSGSFEIRVEKIAYMLRAGDVALMTPMAAHEITGRQEGEPTALVIEVGPVLLGPHFEVFAKASPDDPVMFPCDENGPLRSLLTETAEIFGARDGFSELMLRGNVYKICACLLSGLSHRSESRVDFRAAVKIEKAIELIRSRSGEPLTVELAAGVTGYGKSNFCKIFKNTVGDTFHNVLNRHRVENACCFLEETALPISEIALLAGFADSKSFCRVFKKIKNTSPGRYRKNAASGTSSGG